MPFKLPILYGIVLIILILVVVVLSSISQKPYKTNLISQREKENIHNTTENDERKTDDFATYSPETSWQFLTYIIPVIFITVVLLGWVCMFVRKIWRARDLRQRHLMARMKLRQILQRTRAIYRRDKKEDKSTDESIDESEDQIFSSFEILDPQTLSSLGISHRDKYLKEYIEEWSDWDKVIEPSMNIRSAEHIQPIPESKGELESIDVRNLPDPSRSVKRKSMDIRKQDTSRRNVRRNIRSYGSSSSESGRCYDFVTIQAEIHGTEEDYDAMHD